LNKTATGQELLHIDDNCVNFLAHLLNNQNENIQKQHKSLIKILKTKFNRTKSRADSNGVSNSDEKLSSDDLKVDHSTSTTSGSLKSTAHMPKTDIYSQVANKKLRKLIPFYYGLKNHGNTCFINAIVQPIVHIEPFCFYFLSNNLMNQIYLLQQQQQTIAADTNQPVQTFYLLKAFNALLISMWSNKYEQQHSLDFKNLCGYLNKQFSGQDQNDALEFCLWFLNNLNDEFIQFNKASVNCQTAKLLMMPGIFVNITQKNSSGFQK
jgi:ubiquitin C-terminal hydrolase